MVSMNSALILIIALSSILHSTVLAKPWPAARCLADGRSCNFGTAKRSEFCVAHLPAIEQSTECVEIACKYCLRLKHFQERFPCNSPILGALCRYMNSSESPLSSTVSPSPPVFHPTQTPVPSGCIWTNPDGSDVVIDLSRTTPPDGWTPCYRDGYSGLIYKKDPNERGIDRKGKEGVMCFDVQAPMTGKYYLTALSYAPHNTEHNDVWVSSSKGFELWRRGHMHSFVQPGKWRKAYQNYDSKGIAQFFKTIDFNGHRFLIPDIEKGEVFKVCLSGRSYRFEMFRLVLIRCEKSFCSGRAYKDVEKRVPGNCVRREQLELAETQD